MKILLIGFNVQEDIFPLGLSYIKEYSNKFHPEVDISIKEFAFGTRFKHDTNRTLELQAIAYILQKKPDLVAFSCYIWNHEMVKSVIRAIKKIEPNIKTAIGGVEITDKEENCDFTIIGEGEVALKEIIDHLKGERDFKEIHNLHGHECQIVEILDEIPFPYTGKGKHISVRIETQRGCPYSCEYCYYAKVKCREFSIEYLEKNIKILFENYEFKHLTILDANLNTNKKRMKEVLDIISLYADKNLYVNFELKPELIDEESIKLLNSYKFRIRSELGLQSTDEEVLKECRRPFNLEKVKNGLELLNRSKVKYKIDLMYGLPKDNFFKFLTSLEFVLKHSNQKDVPTHHFMLLNNTDFMQKKDLLRYDEKNSSMVIKTCSEDAKDFYKTKLFLDLLSKLYPK